MHYDTKLHKRQTIAQLKRRGLYNRNLNLDDIGIVDLIEKPDFDTDLYIPVDTGTEEVREDGKAYIIYSKVRRKSDLEIDIPRLLQDKINERRSEIMGAGFSFSFNGTTHILQTRGTDDMLNWTNARMNATENPPDKLMRVRVKSNDNIFITSSTAKVLLRAGVDYMKAIMDNSADLKDAISNAPDDDAAFDIFEAGIDTIWPDNPPFVVE